MPHRLTRLSLWRRRRMPVPWTAGRAAPFAARAGVPAILGPRQISASINIEYRPGMFIVNDNDGVDDLEDCAPRMSNTSAYFYSPSKRNFERTFRNYLNAPVAEPFARFNIEFLVPEDFGPKVVGATPLGEARFGMLEYTLAGTSST